MITHAGGCPLFLSMITRDKSKKERKKQRKKERKIIDIPYAINHFSLPNRRSLGDFFFSFLPHPLQGPVSTNAATWKPQTQPHLREQHLLRYKSHSFHTTAETTFNIGRLNIISMIASM
jgi:hypothetical protein